MRWAVASGQLHRIISLDLETKVLSPDDFLTGETVLSAAIARFDGERVVSRIIILEDESPDAQNRFFTALNDEIQNVRPLVVLGYNVTGYDIPLLQMKLRRLPTPYWAVKDMIERAFILDLKYPIMFELAEYEGAKIKIRSLEDVVNHKRFSSLDLMRTKNILKDSPREEKGARIFRLWKADRDSFQKYALGDVVDTLKLFDEIYLRGPVRPNAS